MVRSQSFPSTFCLLLLILALALQLWGAWRGQLIYDESAHLALAETIDFHPDRFHLVFRTLDHPLLSIYVLKLSSLLFGSSDFGLRMLHVLLGTATVLVIYWIAREAFSERAGLWAAAVLSVDQFHASWSRSFMPEIVMLFFSALALRTFLHLLEVQRRRDWVLLGVWLGLAYLGKETGVLMIPILWGLLIITPRCRWILFSRWWYASHLVFMLVIAPDLAWNVVHFSESYLLRDASMLSEGFQLQMKSFSLFLGELFRSWIDPDVLDADYEQANLYVCHWPAGVVYLCCVLASLRQWAEPGVRLLLVTFFFVFLFFTVLPGGRRYEPFWSASLSLLPAVILTGNVLEQMARRQVGLRVLLVLGICYLAAHYANVASRPGQGYQRQSADEFAAGAINTARFHLQRGEYEPAEKQLIYALNIGGPDVDAYYLLALIHLDRGNRDAALSYLLKCQKLAPDNRLVNEALRRVREAER